MARDTDGTFRTAQAAGTGTYSDNLSSGTDVDMFRFHLEAGETVTLQTFNGGDRIPDTYLALFSSRGEVLDTDDDSGSDIYSSYITYTNNGPAADFYAGVSYYGTEPTGRGQGNYSGGDRSYTTPQDYTLDIVIA